MIRKTVNMVSVNYLQGNSIYLPYAAGTLVAYAQSCPDIRSHYTFENIYFIREGTQSLAGKLKHSGVVGFSSYIWNFEFNKMLAQKVKQINPDCIIIFGGHNINPDGSLLNECPFIDYLIHGEGEEVFTLLLTALARDTDVRHIPNISFRNRGVPTNTPFVPITGSDYPSPYLTGCFDNILRQYPNMDFQAIIETSRGCPYCCTYCDWGNLNSKVKKFPLDRVYAELDWIGEKKIKFLMGADANFGIFARDEKIVDKLVELHQTSGYPESFQTSYAKLSNERIFRMTKKLHNSGMGKGVTISYQSLSDETLSNVKRDNLTVQAFSDLLEKYNRDEIATYTELIIGLPGETLDSFVKGIDVVLKAGQHNSIYFHNCEWLPCSEMEKAEYVSRFQIKTSLIPLNQPHREQIKNDEVKEFSQIVTSTLTMSPGEWIDMNLYSVVIQCFHFYGLLQIFALYLYHEMGVEYSVFYKALMDFVLSPNHPVSYSVFFEIRHKLEEVIGNSGELTCADQRFGNVMWPLDEYAFLLLTLKIEEFHEEIQLFLQQLGIDPNVYDSLNTYQKNIIKLPQQKNISFTTEYDVKTYFESILKGGKKTALNKIRTLYTIEAHGQFNAWDDYAKHVVWYGKKDSRNFYTKEVIGRPDTADSIV